MPDYDRPVQEFGAYFRDQNERLVTDYFENLVKQSGVDEHINIIDSLIISDYKELCRHNNQSKHLEQLNQYIIIINNVIYNRCPHNWIVDEIDIDPDRSIQIKYCELCQLNFDK